MPLSDRIKQLRTEAGLSQAELAKLVGGSDARQISRYENGRITPSLDATIRIAQALNISLDYLAIDNTPRRPLHVEDHGLAQRLAGQLDEDDRQSLLRVLDAFLTRTRLHALTQQKQLELRKAASTITSLPVSATSIALTSMNKCETADHLGSHPHHLMPTRTRQIDSCA